MESDDNNNIIAVDIENHSNQQLGMSHGMLRALGFPMETLPNGITKPMVPMQPSIYDEIKEEEDIIITLYPNVEPMESHIPPGKGQTVEDVVDSINRIFGVFQLPASLKIDDETTELRYTADQKLRLVMPQKLARAIGLLSNLDLQAPGFRQRTNIT